MTNKEAIKYLQQLYPHGGHSWLDAQRMKAIKMAIDALQEEPTGEKQVKESTKIQHDNKTCKENDDSLTQEPVSDDLEAAIDTYLATYFGGEKEKQDWPFLKKMAIHFAAWQKEQIMKDAVDGWIEEPECLAWRVISDNLEGDFVVKNKLQDGESVKVIIIKEE